MTVNKSDFDKICRICLLQKINMLSIYVEETMTAIKNCIDIEIKKGDEFPKSLCTDCLEKIYKYATFRELCKNSERILREIIEKESRVIDDNYNEGSCSNDYTQEVFTTNTENIKIEMEIKEEVIINEETELEYKDDKNNLHIVINNDCDKKNLNERTCISNIQDVKRMIKEIDRTSKKIVYCKICGKKMQESTLFKHLHRHIREKKHKCNQCTKAYREPSDLAKHLVEGHKAKPNKKCDICQKMFIIQAQLDFHMRIHRKKSRTCDICGKDYARLDVHKALHNKSETFFCLKCDASFLHRIYLKNHIKRNHSGKSNKKHACVICNKVVYNIKYHTLNVHSIDKSHKCDHCEKAFAFKSRLLDHVKKKHLGVRDELKALCPTCGKACTSQGELKKHLRTHVQERRLNCHLCEKTYKSSDALRVHLKVHAGLRPYICTHCTKAFRTKVILENHLRIHTGERPFACQICGRAFAQKAPLKTHMKVHCI